MEYTVKGLAELAGVSARTLRWYDAKGLLRPTRVSEAGYRLYDKQAVVRLQQILFYKELGLSLAAIGRILDDPDFNPREALQSHLLELEKRKEQLEALILTIHKTLEDLQGGSNMSDEERFEAFKADMVKQNEEKYGGEVRAKYGDEAADAANAAVLSLSPEDYADWERLGENIRVSLKDAVLAGKEPGGPEGRRIAALHGRWLTYSLGEYDSRKHAGIAALYVADERFTAYYDREATGCARFLRDAVAAYTVSL